MAPLHAYAQSDWSFCFAVEHYRQKTESERERRIREKHSKLKKKRKKSKRFQPKLVCSAEISRCRGETRFFDSFFARFLDFHFSEIRVVNFVHARRAPSAVRDVIRFYECAPPRRRAADNAIRKSTSRPFAGRDSVCLPFATVASFRSIAPRLSGCRPLAFAESIILKFLTVN